MQYPESCRELECRTGCILVDKDVLLGFTGNAKR